MGISRAQIIADAIQRDFIDSGLVRLGQRLPNVRELLKKYSASHVTVVQALNILEAKGSIDKQQGSGCYVKQNAAQIRPTAQNLMGYICQSQQYELIMRIYKGVESVCRREGLYVLLGDCNWDYNQEQKEIQRMIDAGCSAVVIAPTPRTRSQLESDYLKTEFRDYPIVLVDTASPDQRRSQVVFDNYRAGYEMTEMLVHEGHRHIAFMYWDTPQGDLMHNSNHDRYKGYLDALKDAEISMREQDRWIFYTDTYMEQYAEYINMWLDQTDRPTAVLALEDRAAMHTISMARDMGIDVPGQLRVLGFDNLSAGSSFRPHFTTTGQDYVRAGQIAAEMAIQHIRGILKEPFAYMLPVPVRRRKPIVSENEKH